MKPILFVSLLCLPLLSGCFGSTIHSDCWTEVDVPAQSAQAQSTPHDFGTNTQTLYADMGFNGTHWPDLAGQTVRLLDHGAFVGYAFEPAKAAFEALTNATVVTTPADDAGTALQLAMRDQAAGGGSFDVLYGIDNVLMSKAATANIFDSYTPLLGARVASEYRFVSADPAWLATPVDVGYIAVNGDVREDIRLESLGDLVAQADQFVTQDPRFSSVGLGFLVATVAAFGEDCYLGYWEALHDNGLLVTSGWSEAYGQHFSGGFGQYEANPLDRTIVTSYTTSPAYEMYYGATDKNTVLTSPQSTFQQIQTMGILKGANRVAAEAWIEFTLTDQFQSLAAPWNAIYPVVSSPSVDASVHETYKENAPEPGTFVTASLDSQTIGDGIDSWVQDWTDLYQLKQI